MRRPRVSPAARVRDTGCARPAGGHLALATATATGMAVAAIPGYAVGVLAPFLLDDLGIGAAGIGHLVAIVYGVGAILSPAAGRAVDRIGGRGPLLVMIGLAILVIVGLATSVHPAGLYGAMAVGGLGLAIANPSTNQQIRLRADQQRVGMLTGIKQAGVPLAWLVVGSQLPLLIPYLGWRLATMSLLALPAVAAVATAAMRRGPEHPGRIVVRVTRRAGKPLSTAVLAYAAILGMATSGVAAYLPLSGVQLAGLDPSTAGYLAGVVGGTGVVARLSWGWVSGYIERLELAMAALALGGMLAALLVLGSSSTPGLAWVGAALFGASAVSGMVLITAYLLRVAGTASLGRTSGWAALAFFGGFVPGPLTMGALISMTGGYRAPWVLMASLFAIAAILALFGVRSNHEPESFTDSLENDRALHQR